MKPGLAVLLSARLLVSKRQSLWPEWWAGSCQALWAAVCIAAQDAGAVRDPAVRIRSGRRHTGNWSAEYQFGHFGALEGFLSLAVTPTPALPGPGDWSCSSAPARRVSTSAGASAF